MKFTLVSRLPLDWSKEHLLFRSKTGCPGLSLSSPSHM